MYCRAHKTATLTPIQHTVCGRHNLHPLDPGINSNPICQNLMPPCPGSFGPCFCFPLFGMSNFNAMNRRKTTAKQTL